MAQHAQPQFLGGHAGAIVGDLDPVDPAPRQHDRDAMRPRVDGVFHEFLDRRGRTLDHLAGGDAIDGGFR